MVDLVLKMRLFMDCGQVIKFKIKTTPGTTIKSLRAALAKQTNNNPDNLQLSFGIVILDKDHKTLRDYDFDPDTKLDVKIMDQPIPSRSNKRAQDDMSIVSASKRLKPSTNNINSDAMSVMPDEKDDLMSLAGGTVIGGDPVIRTKCRLFVASERGSKSKNEDFVFQYQSSDGSVSAVGVFDGHGVSAFATRASKFSACWARAWLISEENNDIHSWTLETWNNKFCSLFQQMHVQLRRQFKMIETKMRNRQNNSKSLGNLIDNQGIIRNIKGQPIHGGTTATICVVLTKDGVHKYITAHVGDSEAVFFETENHKVKFKTITEGHRALNPKEFKRVRNLPSDKYPKKLQFVYDVGGIKDDELFPRIYLPNGIPNEKITNEPNKYGLYPSNIRQEAATYCINPPGSSDRIRLANTRAIGDYYAHPFGLTYLPDVQINVVSSKPNLNWGLLVASDGVWDVMEQHQVVEFWLQHFDDNLEESATRFLRHVKAKAKDLFGVGVDDASIGLVFFGDNK